MVSFVDERAVVDAALALGADRVAGWSVAEQRLAEGRWPAAHGGSGAGRPADGAGTPGDGAGRPGDGAGRPAAAERVRALILAGEDPLGDAFCRIRPPIRRRPQGQTFTPWPVVDSMIGWAARTMEPTRVVDPGAGSARFLVSAGRRWPDATLIGVENDPVAALIGRGTLAAAGMAHRSRILLADYRSVRLPAVTGPTLFIGNPPYVRHHQIPAPWKQWLRSTAASRGLGASALAGLHVHFFLATAVHAAAGDAGVLVTAAEWLDVNYGALVRSLLLGPLGGTSIHLLDPAVPAFGDAAVTSVITCFRPGRTPGSVRLRRVKNVCDLDGLTGGAVTPAAALRATRRWGPLVASDIGVAAAGPGRGVARSGAAGSGPGTAGLVELGELCRVHRGQVTGANKIWITAGAGAGAGLPSAVLFPAVTRASELFRAGDTLVDTRTLRCVVDLPADLGELSPDDQALVAGFLARARAAGAADSYVAAHRTPWWRVRLGAPAPILATYMARQPPAFVCNPAGARHVNIAHGLYPREPLSPDAVAGLAAFLRRSVLQGQGRTYAGGLTKFEPGEMERLKVPPPDMLPQYVPAVPDVPSPVRSSRGCRGDTTSGTARTSTGWPSRPGSGTGS